MQESEVPVKLGCIYTLNIHTVTCIMNLIVHLLLCCSSALSQPGDITAKPPTDADTPSIPPGSGVEGQAGEATEPAPAAGTELSGTSSANDMLCTSQTLDDEPLTPEVVAPANAIVMPRSVYQNMLCPINFHFTIDFHY